MSKPIGIVLGSYSDVKRMRNGIDRLIAMDVPFEMIIASAHRTPERLAHWLAEAERRGVKVIVAGAGAAAHLPGVVASKTLLPVIGVPLSGSPLGGTDALYSIVQMPPGIPVATVGIDSPENAVVLALHILAVSDAEIREKLIEYRDGWQARVDKHNAELYDELPMVRPEEGEPAPSIDPKPAPAPQAPEPDSPESVKKKRTPARLKTVNPDNPDFQVIEQAVDILLDGGIVAIPTDTVYGLAVDATNAEAVARLRQVKNRPGDKHIPVLIDSTRMLKGLVAGAPEKLDELVEEFWPGALTIVAPKHAASLGAVSDDATLGIRMPDDMVALGLISMLGRPLAVSSANRSGEEPATEAARVREIFGREIDLVIDAGATPGPAVSTVLNIAETPYRVLREGLVGSDRLAGVLGDLLQK